jgi:hypothetical protein
MSLDLHNLGVLVDKRYTDCPHNIPVVAQSVSTGMCWGLSYLREAKVTEEMVIMGCKLPVGTDIVLLTLE